MGIYPCAGESEGRRILSLSLDVPLASSLAASTSTTWGSTAGNRHHFWPCGLARSILEVVRRLVESVGAFGLGARINHKLPRLQWVMGMVANSTIRRSDLITTRTSRPPGTSPSNDTRAVIPRCPIREYSGNWEELRRNSFWCTVGSWLLAVGCQLRCMLVGRPLLYGRD